MGGWKLEVFRMTSYVALPIVCFYLFNKPEYFKDYLIRKKRYYFSNEDPDALINYCKIMSSNSRLPPNPSFILQNSKPVNSILFSKYNKQLLFSGNRNGDLNIYSLSYRRSIFSANPNSEAVLGISEIDQDTFLTHSRNGQIFKWTKQDENSWTFMCIYQKEAYTFCQFLLSYDKNLVFIPSSEPGVVDVLSLDELKISYQIKPVPNSKRGMIMCMKQIEKNFILCGYENGEVALFDGLNEKAQIDLFNGEPVLSFDFCPSKQIGIAGSSGSELKQFTLRNKSGLLELELTASIQFTNPGVNSVKIRPSDSLLVSCACWDSRIRLLSLKKLRLLVVLDFHKEAINSLDFSQDNTLVSGSSDGFIAIWDIYK
ncbi:guanine nucleotide-binding subunit beta 1 [Brachionus plicatilis]|uniref:Guanine nucleotide-binding subunit beta 1 n=1 Tax=Brachionus plicatilis TaxID=10195 RepID=A0A3M7TAJ8_BRAPC|nr:guanine nucleotide-binding subunit beta 1 [Brachionus plicatilis]